MHTSTEIEMVIENCESGLNPFKTAPFWLAGTGRILSNPPPPPPLTPTILKFVK